MIFKVTRLSTELNNLVVYQLYSVRNVEKSTCNTISNVRVWHYYPQYIVSRAHRMNLSRIP